MRLIKRLLEKAKQYHKQGRQEALCIVSPRGGGQWEAAATAIKRGEYETETATFDSRENAILWGRNRIGDNGQMLIDDITE